MPAGDVNSDGLDDILGVDDNRVWVVFGHRGRRSLDLANLNEGDGFLIVAREDAFLSAIGIGDFNGDGFDDVALGDQDYPVSNWSGVTSVVLGSAEPSSTVRLDVPIAQEVEWGFRLVGAGTSVHPMGDINDDGFADFLTAALFGDSAYILYGTENPRDLTLTELSREPSRRGYAVPWHGCFLGQSHDGLDVGDVDGDERLDLIVKCSGDYGYGHVLVIWGLEHPGSLPVGHKDWGFRIRPSRPTGGVGTVTSAGDMDGDGRDDIAIQEGGQHRYVVHVIPGRRYEGRVDLDEGSEIEIEGEPDVNFGHSLTSLETNGDGYSDLVVGAPGTGATNSGTVYVLLGNSKWRATETDALTPNQGFVLDGTSEYPGVPLVEALSFGYYLAVLRDFDGDSDDELLVGSLGEGRGPQVGWLFLGDPD